MYATRSRLKNDNGAHSPAATLVAPSVIQRKLTVGAVDDPFEREADATADKVMRMPETPMLQRKCVGCEEEEQVQRKPLAAEVIPNIQRKGSEVGVASDAVTSRIEASRGSGSPLPKSTRSFMESRFGTDFSDVRLHTDGDAAQMSRELNAQAFTVGSDVFFNAGKYSPESSEGKQLLAHELTHTLQQRNGMVSRKVEEKKPCAVHAYDNSNPKDTAVIPSDGSGVGVSSVPDLVTQVNAYVNKEENHCSCVSRLEVNGHGASGYQSVGNGNLWIDNEKALIHSSKDDHLKQLQSIKFCPSGVFILMGCHVGSGTDKGEKLLGRISTFMPGVLVGGAQHYTHGTGLGQKKVVGAGDELDAAGNVKDVSKSLPFLSSPYVTWFITINNKEYKIRGADVGTEDNNAKLKQAEKIKVKTNDGIYTIK